MKLFNFQFPPKKKVTGEQLAELKVKHGEGLKLKMYKCSEGYNSIGYGFNLDANKITPEIAEMLFRLMFDPAVKDAKDFAGKVWNELNEVRQAVLIDMAYNLGRGGLFSMWSLQTGVREKRFDYAAKRMRSFLWYKQIQKFVKPPNIGRAETLARQMESGEL
jgi:lysozyme